MEEVDVTNQELNQQSPWDHLFSSWFVTLTLTFDLASSYM